MYFGSVRFFKDLILTAVFGIIIISVGFAIFFGIMYSKERSKTLETMAKYQKAVLEGIEPASSDLKEDFKNVDFDHLYELLKNRGFTTEDIINVLAKYDNESLMEIFFNKYCASEFFVPVDATEFNPEYFPQDEEPSMEDVNGDYVVDISAKSDVLVDKPGTSLEASVKSSPIESKEVPVSNAGNDYLAVAAEEDSEQASFLENGDYTFLYPELFVEPPTQFKVVENTIYLTFDDGPSENTLLILSTLDKYDIKATFFVKGAKTERDKEILRKIVDSGNTIGIHSISHDYEKIYDSVESFLDDLNNTYNNIYEVTGIKPDILRFPGGSINSFNKHSFIDIFAEVKRRGFVYFDWNVSGDDTAKDADWTSIYNNILKGIKNQRRGIILLHDSANMDNTASVLEDIILGLKARGFSFDKLSNNIMPINFKYEP